jgi:hypothetical protein
MAAAGKTDALTIESSVRRTGDMFEADVDGELIGLHLGAAAYFSFNQVGSRVWRLLNTSRRIGDICEQLEREFDVPPDVCEAQVLRMLEDLRVEGLITPVSPGGPSDAT